MTQGTILEQVDRTPVTFVLLIAYVTLAFLTDPIDPTFEQLIDHGGCSALLVQDGEPWRLITAAFLHGGLIHLMFNSYCLLMVGPMLETSLGSVRFVLLYAVSAVAGSIAAILWMGDLRELVVGGSGALFGMFGAIVALNMRGGRHLFEFLQFRGPRSIVVLIGVNLVIGLLVPVISNSAHVGGLIGGFVFAFLFLDRGRHQRDGITRVIQLGWLAVFLSCGAYCLKPVAHLTYHLLPLWTAEMTKQEWESHPERYREAMRKWR